MERKEEGRIRSQTSDLFHTWDLNGVRLKPRAWVDQKAVLEKVMALQQHVTAKN